jgi:hypothetical protein
MTGSLRRLRLAAIALTVAAVVGLPAPAIAATPAAVRPSTPAATPPAPRPATAVRLSVMTQNMFYGGDDYDLKTGGFCPVSDGCPRALHRIAAAITKAKADVVGLQETERNTSVLAGLLGWYSSPRAHVISRYPIIEPPGSGGMYVFVEPAPGRVVAVADFHLPSTPYGPYEVRDGATKKQVLKLENTLRVPYMTQQLAALKRLEAQGFAIFVTGDFNSPSYLDWTAAVAKVRSDVPYPVRWPVSYDFARAGFGDSFRDIYPDPVATPGFTWTPGGPETDPHEVFDRIDWVLHAGPATTLDSKIVGEVGGPDVGVSVPAPYPSDHRGVVSTFRVDALTPLPFAATQQRRIIQGDTISVQWQLGAGSGQRVGIVRPTAQGDVWVRSISPSVDFGQAPIAIGNLAPGRYDVALAGHDGRIRTREPVYVYRPTDHPTVTPTKPTFRVGETLRISWTEAPGNGLDWIGIFPCSKAGVCGDNSTYLLYNYTQTAIEGTLSIGADRGGFEGTSAPWPLPPGKYVARLLIDDSYISIGQSPIFTIVK